MEKLDYYSLVQINDIKIIDWKTISFLTVTWEDLIKFDIALTNNWDILNIDWENIVRTFDLKDFLGKKFLPYSFDEKYIYWIMDKNLNWIEIPYDLIIKDVSTNISNDINYSLSKMIKNNPTMDIDYWSIINNDVILPEEDIISNKYIFNIKKKFIKWDITYYSINDRNDLIISEGNLSKYLDNFVSFSSVKEEYLFNFDSTFNMKLDWLWVINTIKILINLDESISFYTMEDKKIDTDLLISELNKSKEWKEVLYSISQKLS